MLKFMPLTFVVENGNMWMVLEMDASNETFSCTLARTDGRLQQSTD
jgi:hypothetical protein